MRPGRVLLVVAAGYLAALAVVVLWPTPVDNALQPFHATHPHLYDALEFTANVALFVPLGWLGVALSSRARWWHVTAAGLSLSIAVETTQALLRPERFATVDDVVANTLGATIGALLAARMLRRGGQNPLGRARPEASTSSAAEG